MIRQLRIKVNDIFLNFKKSDLKISEENNSFIDSFKVSHNSYPLRIIEDKEAINALGDPSTAKTFKKNNYNAIIFIGSSKYSGILEVKSILNGFRKANIKFGSAIIPYMDKKIASFFTPINLMGLDPIDNPYLEESDIDFANSEYFWNSWQNQNLNKIFPEVDFQLPKMRWQNKFGETEKGDDWHYFKDYYNNRDSDGNLYTNEVLNDDNQEIDYWSENKNIISPQVFLLSPLYKFANHIGYKVRGSFLEHPLIPRVLFTSFADQMYNFNFLIEPVPINALTSAPWNIPSIVDVVDYGITTYFKQVVISNPGVGDWKLRFKFNMNHQTTISKYKLWFGFDGEYFDCFDGIVTSSAETEIHQGEVSFSVSAQSPAITLFFMCNDQFLPLDYELSFNRDIGDVNLYKVHPTLDFSRYLPNWSVSSYINNLKNFFNLKIDVDDISKTLFFNFNEKDYLIEGKIFKLQQSIFLGNRETPSNDSFLFKFDNPEDDQVYISNEETAVNRESGEYTTEIANKFKYIPIGAITAELSENLEDKGGIGLMIYSLTNAPNIASNFSGLTLNLSGSKGIVESFWKVWIRMRLNAHSVNIQIPLTNTELLVISKLRKISTGGQLFLVKKSEYQESNNGFLDSKIELESVNL